MEEGLHAAVPQIGAGLQWQPVSKWWSGSGSCSELI